MCTPGVLVLCRGPAWIHRPNTKYLPGSREYPVWPELANQVFFVLGYPVRDYMHDRLMEVGVGGSRVEVTLEAQYPHLQRSVR